MTQPGVSQHIKKLEQQTGTPLLQRFGKRFELTPAGETLYRYAAAVVTKSQRYTKSYKTMTLSLENAD